MDKNSGGTVTKTTVYYPVGGAMRVNGTLYYVLKDHLGSASVVTDNSGNVVGDQRYYPFGETRLSAGSMYTDKLFTGQREMTGLGIYHYGARFYSPKLGRFLSADSLVPNMANPQALNRYSYVFNRPLRYVDPSGNIPIDCWNDPSYCSNTTTLPTSPYSSNRPNLPGNGGGGGGSSGGRGGGGGGKQYDVTEFTVLEMQAMGEEIETLLPLYTEEGGAQFIYGWMLGTFNPYGPKNIKVALNRKLGDGVILCGSNDVCRWVDYSTPGNILFGYSAEAAGIPKGFYYWVGGLQQPVDDAFGPNPVNWGWCTISYCDDPADFAAVQFGASLYTSGDNITVQEFQSALTADILDTFQSPPPGFTQPFPPVSQENQYVPGDFDYPPD
ncbi:MAG: RHS repeat-associated core domain-containing protein [Chloroflexota bacterium]